MSETTTSTLDVLKPTNAVKILSQTDTTARVGGYGVVFGGKDLEGETFEPDTDYMMDLVPNKPIFYDHAQQKDVTHPIGQASNESILFDEIGIWVEGELDKSRQYVDGVLKLISEGVIGWSSGAISHLARREGGIIKSWPLVEFSLTATPAEPRTLGVERIKQLAKDFPSLKALIPESAQESASDDATAEEADAKKNIGESETGEIMTEKEQEKQAPEQVDNGPVLEAIGNIAESLKAFDARLDKLEAPEPRADNPIDAVKGVNVAQYQNLWKYDHLDTGDLAAAISILGAAARDVNGQPATLDMVKALAVRLLEDDKKDINGRPLHARSRTAMKSAFQFEPSVKAINGAKANELNYSTQAGFGDEWIGVTYANELWPRIVQDTPVINNIPTMEVPQGSESVIIPLDGAPPTFYTVAQATATDSNPGPITRTVKTSKQATARQTLTVGKLGAGVDWTGELNEDAVVNFAEELRRNIQQEAAEVMEHIAIDGDTEAGATTNINDIGGTPAGDEAFMLLNGFRKLALVTNTANSRDGGALTVEDYLETLKLMGLAGRNVLNREGVAFIQDAWTNWKALTLTEVKTQDVFSRPTVENGMLTSIWGRPVITSANMHRANQDATYGLKANTAGKLNLDTASANTTGAILAVRWDQWRLGFKRRITFEVERVPRADAFEITALMRVGMIYRDNEAAAVTYNLTL